MTGRKRLLKPSTPPSGVTERALYHIEQLVKSGRQVYGVPAASLTWGIDGEGGEEVNAGIEGEKKTGKILAEWVKRHPDALVFHSVRWPGSEGDTDHMVVVGRNVILIDSKRWKAKRKYSVTARGSILRGTVAFPEGNVKMLPAMKSWREVFGKGVRVQGVVCISQDEVFVPYDENWRKAPFKLVTAEKLEEFLDRHLERNIKKENRNVFDMGIISKIAVRLVKPRNRRAEVINLKAAKKAGISV